jgi:hypothetical protein
MQSLIDWLLTPLVTTALVSSLLFLFRNSILTRLRASVQHEFNAKLETMRAELRRSEELLRADLRAKESHIEALRSGALSGMASRQALFDQRRLAAVEQLWDGIDKLASFKIACSMMATIDFKKSLKLSAQDPKVRQFFMQIGSSVDPSNFRGQMFIKPVRLYRRSRGRYPLHIMPSSDMR